MWQDFVYLASAALAQPCDFQQKREDEYLHIIGKYDKEEQERFPRMFAEIVKSLEKEEYADILGELYTQLGLCNKQNAQFFTPYYVSKFMAKSNYPNLAAEIEQKGYITVGDPCCGAGALLVAFAEECREQEVNYHNHVVFVAQDIDPIVARMCFIQLALLGCAGYVRIGNSLTQPPEHSLFPEGNADCSNIWFTPMWFSDVWHMRRAWYGTDLLMRSAFDSKAEPEVESVVDVEKPVTETEDEPTKTALYQQLDLFGGITELDPDSIDELN